MNQGIKNIWTNDHIEWIDITNPNPDELLLHSREYNLDYHTLSDCLEPEHLPKKETLPDFTFLILRVHDGKAKKFPSSIQDMSNKIAVFYNNRIIFTIHRVHAEIIDEIRTGWCETGKITETCEIVTRIMWHVISSYEPNALDLSKSIDYMEKQVFIGRLSRVSVEQMYYLKNSCRLNRRIISLSKDVIMQHSTSPKDESALQDVKDLLQKLSLYLDEAHDDISNLSSVYLSMVSMKTNDVVKLLTLFSVFFMPLTFIVGIYGMNFEYMPELSWRWGYPVVMILMLLICVVIFVWFKRKKII